MARSSEGPRLKRNERGIYEIRWTERGPAGESRSRRLSTGTDHLPQAQATFAGWLSEEAVDSGRMEPTIGQCIDRYREDHVRAGQVANTQRSEIALRWLEAHFANIRPSDLEDRHVLAYGKARRSGTIGHNGRGVGDASVRRELVDLKAALNFCARKRYLSPDKVPHISLPDDSEPRDFWLTEDEWAVVERRIADEADAEGALLPVHRLVLMAYYTASRVTPILLVTPRLIEGDPPQTIRYDRVRLPHGKRTKKRRVAIPVASRLRSWLVQALRQHRDEGKGQDDPIVPFANRTRANQVLAAWARKVAADTDNPRLAELHPHALRHTRATHLLRAGASLWDVAGVLGDSVATVEKTYGHHAADHLGRIVDL